jgi:hypothetical protein
LKFLPERDNTARKSEKVPRLLPGAGLGFDGSNNPAKHALAIFGREQEARIRLALFRVFNSWISQVSNGRTRRICRHPASARSDRSRLQNGQSGSGRCRAARGACEPAAAAADGGDAAWVPPLLLLLLPCTKLTTAFVSVAARRSR